MKREKFFIFLSLLLSIYTLANLLNFGEHDQQFEYSKNHCDSSIDVNDLSEKSDIFDTCPLKIYDPYYKEMGMTIRLLNPLDGCNKNYTPFTKLENGKAFLRKENFDKVSYCRGRCYKYVHFLNATAEPWTNFTGNEKIDVPCDFFKTECFSSVDGKSIDQWMHVQIVENNHSTVQVRNRELPGIQPDVYMFFIDAVSSTQARRSLPRTLSFLETKMGAIQFHHLNKIGENTKHNAYAIFLGWRIVDVNREAVNAPNLGAQYKKKQWCDTYRDNDTVIWREFEKAGYKTAYCDDYKFGPAFSRPNCKSFKVQEANHLIRPLISTHADDEELRKYMNERNCWEMHKSEFHYMQQFFDSYKGKPKFGVLWSNGLSHDDANMLFHADADFYEFFQKNQAKLENAFVFLMGDHGMPFGAVASTKLGKIERKNPFLQITIPKFLRQNKELMKNLEENSKRLVTQYDVHATLVDILKFGLPSNFTDFSEKEIFEKNENNGTSLLRHFNEKYQRRTCRNIPVDTSFCLCEYEKEEISDKLMIKESGKVVVNEVNKMITERGANDLCHQLTLDTIKVTGFVPVEKTRTYEVGFKVKPSGGSFRTMLKLDPNSNVLQKTGEILRVNKYGNQSACLNSLSTKYNDLMEFCFCK